MKEDTVSLNSEAFKYAAVTSPKIEKLCAPLFSSFGFTIFAYIKVLPDGKMLHLNSNSDWTKTFFEQEFYNEDDCFHKIRNLVAQEGDKTFILSGIPQGKHPLTLHEFNIWNTYSIYKKRDDYVEGWAFGTNRDNINILDIYFKNPYILHAFTLYFSEKAFDFTTNANSCNLIHTNRNIHEELDIKKYDIKGFLQTIFPRRFPIKFRGKKIIFSKREIECLSVLSSGHSIKETSNILGISPRTVEEYINKMRSKANAYNKNDLIKMYLDSFDSYEIGKIYKIIKKMSLYL